MMSSLTDLFSSLASGYATPEYLTRLSYVESRNNPKAQSPYSSAGGLLQFVNKTWKQYGSGDRFVAENSIVAGVKLTNDNGTFLEKLLGREPSPGELYLAHQQGAAGAKKILSNPNVDAVQLLGKKAVLDNGGTIGMTAKEFGNLWIDKFEKGMPNGKKSSRSETIQPPKPSAKPKAVLPVSFWQRVKAILSGARS